MVPVAGVATPLPRLHADVLRVAGAAAQAAEGKGDLRLRFSNDDLAGRAPGITVDQARDRATETLAAGVSLFWRLRAHPAFLSLDDGAFSTSWFRLPTCSCMAFTAFASAVTFAPGMVS